MFHVSRGRVRAGLALGGWHPSLQVLAVVGKESHDEDTLTESQRNRTFKVLLTATLSGTLIGSLFIVQFLIVNQQNLIARFFLQRLTIVRPYISENEFKLRKNIYR